MVGVSVAVMSVKAAALSHTWRASSSERDMSQPLPSKMLMWHFLLCQVMSARARTLRVAVVQMTSTANVEANYAYELYITSCLLSHFPEKSRVT